MITEVDPYDLSDDQSDEVSWLALRDEIARAYDPDAFEKHAWGEMRTITMKAWAARRRIAIIAADRLMPWLARHDRHLIEECASVAEGAYPLGSRVLGGSHMDQVREFHERFLLPIGSADERYRWHGALRDFRHSLLREEFVEYQHAEADDDYVALADSLGDMLYVIYGTALTFGIDLDAVVDEIHRSNMTKTQGPGGKPTKGAAYEPPNLVPLLGIVQASSGSRDG